MKGFEVSVDELLAAKDTRIRQLQQMASHHQGTLVCFKLNIPGPIKNSELIVKTFIKGIELWVEKLTRASLVLLDEKIINEKTGPEYFVAVDHDPLLIKKITTEIEETHPLGRLFDFDVIDRNLKSYSRTEIGHEPRKCLLCAENAFVCGRSRSHPLSELTTKITKLITAYFVSK